jgi:PAS domain S-box-containing protein
MKTLRILYLEDTDYDVDLVREYLEEDGIVFDLIHVKTKEDFINALKEEELDIILADFSLPSFDGLEALDITQQLISDIPFIIISGVMGEELAIEALKSGATDYVLKQRLSRLVPSISRALLEANERATRLKAESERQKYDFIVNASKSMFTLVDRNYTYEAVNDAFCKAHNLVRDQIIGKSLKEVWGEDSFDKYIKKNFDDSFRNNVVRYQAWFEVPSRGLRCFEVTFYPYKEKGDDVTHTVVDTMDITDKQKAEEAMRESEAKYRLLFDHAAEAILLEKDGLITTCNTRAVEYFGYTKQQLLSMGLLDLLVKIQPDGSDASKHASELQAVTSKGELLGTNWEFKKKNKRTFIADVSAASFQLKGETFYQFFIHDITEKAKAEESLKRLAEAMEQSVELVAVTDIKGHFVYVNKAYVDKLEYSKKEIIGKHITQILPPAVSKETLYQMNAVLADHKVWSGDLDILSKRKQQLLVSARVSPIRSKEGDITSYVYVLRDITEESKIKAYLRQAQKMETIGTLAGGIAHDFNNIIATITGHTDIALQDIKPDNPVYEDLEQIAKATERAKGLVNQILTFSRQVETKPEEVRIDMLITEAIKLLAASVPKNIRIKQDMAAECGGVMADPSQLHQVIMNICTNAIYAMKDSGGILHIRLKSLVPAQRLKSRFPELEDKQYISLTFKDTGTGMDDATAERIFEPFFTTKPVGEGTGLGLSVVHGIVKSLGGEIFAESTPGKGSTFTILLPCLEEEKQKSLSNADHTDHRG